jgi:hypothetical protein
VLDAPCPLRQDSRFPALAQDMQRKLSVHRSAIHGRGIFAAVDLPAGTQLIEYKGRRLTHAEAHELYGGTAETGHTFLFTLNDHYLIDGNFGGNSARWINHSCEPNCQATIYVDVNYNEARDKVYIETTKPVRAGEEFTYDYGIILAQRHTAKLKSIWRCLCGSANCTGTLLKPRKRASQKR